MPKGSNQKYKLIYLARIFESLTADEHALSVSELINELAKYDVSVERKTLYDDFDTLREFGYDIIQTGNGRYAKYFLGERKFELAELKLLSDAIGASKFITEKKSKVLIKKLE